MTFDLSQCMALLDKYPDASLHEKKEKQLREVFEKTVLPATKLEEIDKIDLDDLIKIFHRIPQYSGEQTDAQRAYASFCFMQNNYHGHAVRLV